jgi:hypothetical protein
VSLYVFDEWLAAVHPGLGTDGAQLVVVALFCSTTILYHLMFAVNSLRHTYGRRRYDTRDESRNLWWLALITAGEGWHNNHHRYPASERQGFYWWSSTPPTMSSSRCRGSGLSGTCEDRHHPCWSTGTSPHASSTILVSGLEPS